MESLRAKYAVLCLFLLLALLCPSARSSIAHKRLGDNERHLVSVPRSYVTAQALYSNFQSIFGPTKLSQSVFSAQVLSTVVDAAGGQQALNSRKIACTSYAKGFELSSKVRHDEVLAIKASLHVYLVSRRANQVCFFYKYLPNELLAAVKYAYPIPSALKIHHVLYKAIEKLAHTQSTQQAFPRASFLPPHPHYTPDVHLTLTNYFGDGAEGTRSTLALAASLAKYDTSAFKSFFWTSSAPAFFKSLQTQALSSAPASHYVDTLSMELDRQRSKTWASLSSVLKKFSLNSSNGTKPLSVSDPCKFAGLQTRSFTGKLLLSVTHLVDHPDPQIGAACLSFMVAHLLSASDSSIYHVSLTTGAVLLNNNARPIVEGASASVGETLNNQVYTSNNLVGMGEVLAMADTGVDVYSCYFYDPNGRAATSDISAPTTDTSNRKVIQYTVNGGGGDTTDAPSGHGTHVAGTLAGFIPNVDIATDPNGKYDGIAPGAKLAVLDLGVGASEGLAIPGTADLTYTPGYTAGARIHSNSWGSFFQAGDQGHYASSDLDNWLFTHPDFTIFFAAGNGGDVAYATSEQAQAKNVIAVASSETTLNSDSIANVAWYSSFGPAYDGRIKPDCTAPGDSIMSANAQGDGSQTCSQVSKTGTSQATPACAGSAALIRQYFADSSFFATVCSQGSAGSSAGCGPMTASGVLVKAMVLNSGTQMAMYHNSGSDQNLGSPPDSTQGYGRVTLQNVLPLPQAGVVLFLYVDDQASLSSNSQKSYSLTVTDSTYPLRTTISWYDAPNQDGITTQALLNDLDLLLVSPSGTQYYGNGAANGNSGFDSINNNEQVSVASPETGTWTLTISSQALFSSDAQAFSLVATLQGSVNSNDSGSGSSSSSAAEPTSDPASQPASATDDGGNTPAPASDDGSTGSQSDGAKPTCSCQCSAEKTAMTANAKMKMNKPSRSPTTPPSSPTMQIMQQIKDDGHAVRVLETGTPPYLTKSFYDAKVAALLPELSRQPSVQPTSSILQESQKTKKDKHAAKNKAKKEHRLEAAAKKKHASEASSSEGTTLLDMRSTDLRRELSPADKLAQAQTVTKQSAGSLSSSSDSINNSRNSIQKKTHLRTA